MNCISFGKKVAGLSNYGNKHKPLCYDCVSTLSCEACNTAIPIGEQTFHDGKLLCRKCYNPNGLEAGPSANGATSVDGEPNEKKLHQRNVWSSTRKHPRTNRQQFWL